MPRFSNVFFFLGFHQAYTFRLQASGSWVSNPGNRHTEEEALSSEEMPHGMSISDHHNATSPPKWTRHEAKTFFDSCKEKLSAEVHIKFLCGCLWIWKWFVASFLRIGLASLCSVQTIHYVSICCVHVECCSAHALVRAHCAEEPDADDDTWISGPQ